MKWDVFPFRNISQLHQWLTPAWVIWFNYSQSASFFKYLIHFFLKSQDLMSSSSNTEKRFHLHSQSTQSHTIHNTIQIYTNTTQLHKNPLWALFKQICKMHLHVLLELFLNNVWLHINLSIYIYPHISWDCSYIHSTGSRGDRRELRRRGPGASWWSGPPEPEVSVGTPPAHHEGWRSGPHQNGSTKSHIRLQLRSKKKWNLLEISKQCKLKYSKV